MDLLLVLDNDENDKGDIQKSLRNFDCSVAVEDGRIVIKTSALVHEFDVCDHDSVSIVWDCVNDFIGIVNGTALVLGFSMNPLALNNVKYVNENGNIEYLKNIGKAHVVLPGIITSTPDVSKILPLALTNQRVANVLRLCSRELDWVNLYRIYEMVYEEVGGKDDDPIKAFKASANNRTVTGDFARHGKMNEGTPKITMELADAQHLIKLIVREWMYKKISVQSQ